MHARIPTPPPFLAPHADNIKLPADQYLHPDAPTEWWWHTGTLTSGDRVFGFEINAANLFTTFTQVMLTDVTNNVNYKQTLPQKGGTWAESDPTKDWFVKLGDPATSPSWITMNAPHADPTKNMAVKAALVDPATGKKVTFSLTLSQEGPPFIVWGSGVSPNPPVAGGVKNNNYYYSLTRLHATGTIAIGDEVLPVTGLTWMDHEYGLFGSSSKPVKWFLQNMQLNNGVHISNSVSFPDAPPALNTPAHSVATIQFPDGTTYFETNCILTPIGRTWTSPTGTLFFMEFKIEIPEFDGAFTVTSLIDDQDFPFPGGIADTYEGVATAKGTFMGHEVHGTAWNEQQP